MTANPEHQAIEVLSLDALKHIDAICSRFEADWTEGARPALEDYLATNEEPLRSNLFRELLQAEQELCQQWGEPVQAASLHARFPEYAGIIDAVLGTTGRG
jgi:hypothetical protein